MSAGTRTRATMPPGSGPWIAPELVSRTTPVHAGFVTAHASAEPDFDMHYGLEVGVVLNGRMRRLWQDWQSELAAGQVWLCGMWEAHGWQPLTPSCTHFVLVLLPEWLIGARFQEAPEVDWMAPFITPPKDRPQAAEHQRRELVALIERFRRRISPDSPSRSAFLEVLSLEVLLVVLDGWRPTARRPVPESDRYLAAVDQAAQTALRARQALTAQQAAEACGMSARTFAAVFRDLMGIPFHQYALRSRLGRAAGQLVQRGSSVSSIAAECGFAHVSSFRRAFRQHYGVSPAAYRRKRR